MQLGTCRVHKPRVPRGPASTPRLGPSRQHTTHGPAQESKNNRPEEQSSHRPEGLTEEERRPLVDYFGPPLRSERSLRTPAASGWPLRSEGLTQALLPTPTPRLRPGFTETLLTALLRLARPEPTGPSDRGRPLGRNQGTNGESKSGRTSQTMIPGTIPCTPAGTVLCNRPDTNNIIGADISLYSIVGAVNSHTVRPPTCP